MTHVYSVMPIYAFDSSYLPAPNIRFVLPCGCGLRQSAALLNVADMDLCEMYEVLAWNTDTQCALMIEHTGDDHEIIHKKHGEYRLRCKTHPGVR